MSCSRTNCSRRFGVREREHHLLARHVQLARGPVERGEDDLLGDRLEALRAPPGARRARVGDLGRRVGGAAERQVEADQDEHRGGRVPDRTHQTPTSLRPRTIGTSASRPRSADDEERARERVRDRPVELILERVPEIGVRGIVSMVDDRLDVGDPTFGRGRSTATRTSRATPILSSGEIRLSSTAAVPAASASCSFRLRSEVKIGVSRSSPSTIPAWRAAIVQPPCTACPERPASARSVSAESASPSPAPIAICGRHRPHDARVRKPGQGREAAGDQDRARGGPRPERADRCRRGAWPRSPPAA